MDALENFVLVHHTHDEDIEVAHQKKLLEQQRKKEERKRQRQLNNNNGNGKAEENAGNHDDDDDDDEDEDDENNDLVVPDLARNMYMHMLVRCNGKDVVLKREIDGAVPPTLGRIAKKFKVKPEKVHVQTEVDSTSPSPSPSPTDEANTNTNTGSSRTVKIIAKAEAPAAARGRGKGGAPGMRRESGPALHMSVDEDVRGNPMNLNSKDPRKLTNYWAFRQGCTLVVGDSEMPVMHHAPVVVSLFVRGFPMVGSMLHPIATLHNCTHRTCICKQDQLRGCSGTGWFEVA